MSSIKIQYVSDIHLETHPGNVSKLMFDKILKPDAVLEII
jgi:hypothetical protein